MGARFRGGVPRARSIYGIMKSRRTRSTRGAVAQCSSASWGRCRRDLDLAGRGARRRGERAKGTLRHSLPRRTRTGLAFDRRPRGLRRVRAAGALAAVGRQGSRLETWCRKQASPSPSSRSGGRRARPWTDEVECASRSQPVLLGPRDKRGGPVERRSTGRDGGVRAPSGGPSPVGGGSKPLESRASDRSKDHAVDVVRAERS